MFSPTSASLSSSLKSTALSQKTWGWDSEPHDGTLSPLPGSKILISLFLKLPYLCLCACVLSRGDFASPGSATEAQMGANVEVDCRERTNEHAVHLPGRPGKIHHHTSSDMKIYHLLAKFAISYGPSETHLYLERCAFQFSFSTHTEQTASGPWGDIHRKCQKEYCIRVVYSTFKRFSCFVPLSDSLLFTLLLSVQGS